MNKNIDDNDIDIELDFDFTPIGLAIKKAREAKKDNQRTVGRKSWHLNQTSSICGK